MQRLIKSFGGFFWQRYAGCWILVPQPGIEPGLPAMKVLSPKPSGDFHKFVITGITYIILNLEHLYFLMAL